MLRCLDTAAPQWIVEVEYYDRLLLLIELSLRRVEAFVVGFGRILRWCVRVPLNTQCRWGM